MQALETCYQGRPWGFKCSSKSCFKECAVALRTLQWQRCQIHLQQNAQSYVPRQSMSKEVAADIQAMFNAPDKKSSEQYLQVTIQKYARSAPRLSAWMEENLAEGF